MANNGAFLEGKLHAAGKAYMRAHPGYWHRFYDTKSTGGGFLPAQPGDFLLLAPGLALLIECKSSAVSAPLLTLAWAGKPQKLQIAKHRLWRRAGQASCYLYLDLTTRRLEWHDGASVAAKVNAPYWSGALAELPAALVQAVNYHTRNTKDICRALAV